ncbi:hypothetical protein [Actinomadura sp. WAC 06369]|uniref:hypothetical protein n=1 Tax=Actinomadura sp. WAC 06369 TaxID=2203193 RepID=UPI000F78C51D|nr:hypothetical protein [Actinomadura sp. WAC 06369]RSN71155.1 hypothetical protein DMH08_03205 [Actinomadura sp. WAC 06369]
MALAALASGDREAVAGALFHLAENLLHQGTIYGQRGPAALYVAAQKREAEWRANFPTSSLADEPPF